MTTFYSTEMTKILATPMVHLDTLQHHGRIRIAAVNYDQVAQGSAGDLLQMAKLPAGRVKLLGPMCNLYVNLAVGSAKLDMGWAAYTDLDGDAVTADPNGLDNQVNVESAGAFAVGTVSAVAIVGGVKTFESQEGVIITGTMSGVPAAGDDIKGYLAYVLD